MKLRISIDRQIDLIKEITGVAAVKFTPADDFEMTDACFEIEAKDKAYSIQLCPYQKDMYLVNEHAEVLCTEHGSFGSLVEASEKVRDLIEPDPLKRTLAKAGLI